MLAPMKRKAYSGKSTQIVKTSITLPEVLVRFIEAKMSDDGYPTLSSYLVELLHRAKERDEEKQIALGKTIAPPAVIRNRAPSSTKSKTRCRPSEKKRAPEHNQPAGLSARPHAMNAQSAFAEYLRACGDCGREISIRAAACPHCGAPGHGAPKPDPIRFARIKSKSEGCGLGCVLQILGLALLFWFPFGTVLGVALLVWGHVAACKYTCGDCGNALSSKSVKLCPACQAHFQ